MSAHDDYSLALKLQREFDRELQRPIANVTADEEIEVIPFHPNRKRRADDAVDLNATQNIVHPQLEIVDPTPDIFALFGAFDQKFFNSKLQCVQLEWSKKMYSCAGICYQRRNLLGMSCIIRLSEPLLKLRPRKNLVETLLHEMIHAYLFTLNIREGNGGHGPNFHRIMTRINTTAGTNITVYHTFSDEVNLYKTHIWRCNGLCQHRKPFFGYVRRTCNREPGPNDQWWAQHQATCGGYFKKISEPEPKKRGPKSKESGVQRIDDAKWGMTKKGKPVTAASAVRTITKPNTPSRTITSMGTTQNNVVTLGDPTRNALPRLANRPTGNLNNIISFKDLNSLPSSSSLVNPKPTLPMVGGRKIGSATMTTGNPNISPSQQIKNTWSSRFIDTTPMTTDNTTSKKPRLTSTPQNKIPKSDPWQIIDDDILIHDPKPEIIAVSDDSDDDTLFLPTPAHGQHKWDTSDERQKYIKQEILDGDDDSDIELIDDEFDDKLADVSIALGDTSVIDDIFGQDTLMTDFNQINNVIMSDVENFGRPEREIISCPICHEKMSRDLLSEHLNGCQGIVTKIMPIKAKGAATPVLYKGPMPKAKKQTEKEILLEAGYSEDVVNKFLVEQREEQAYNQRILGEMEEEIVTATGGGRMEELVQHGNTRYVCPICQQLIISTEMNDHLDICLQNEDQV